MKRTLTVLLVLMPFVMSVFGTDRMSERLQQEMYQAFESRQPLEVVIQLEKQVRITENGSIIKFEDSVIGANGQFDRSSGTLSRRESVLSIIMNKPTDEILNYSNPDGNGQLVVNAIPAVLMELADHPEVLGMDLE